MIWFCVVVYAAVIGSYFIRSGDYKILWGKIKKALDK